MPKLIDHEKRKRSIAEATWRIILHQGMEDVSVRAIAKEASLSLGSLRYYFSAQEELLAYARDLVDQNLTERIDKIFQEDLPPKEKILQVLLELLPASGDTKLEAKVRMVFKVHFRHKKENGHAPQDGVLPAIKNIMSTLVLLNLLKKEADLHLETERLYALVDGLALDSLARPELWNKEKLRAVLVYHLNSICIEDFDA